MMRLMKPKKDKLIQKILQCRGKVFLHANDGTLYDLEENSTAMQFLRIFDLPSEGIELEFADAEDRMNFLSFLTNPNMMERE